MKRPTIADLAQAAGVSVSTVNRILNGSAKVETATIERVREAATGIGFYGLNVIDARKDQSMPRRRLGFLLQQSSRELYRLFGRRIEEAAAQRRGERIEPVLEFVDRLEPETIAARLRALAAGCDAVAVIAGDHPLIGQTIQALKADGKPVVAYITDLSAPDRAGYVGTDNWKLGRTAAWFIAETARGPGRVAVLIGNHRYQCQDVSDASFRSYMRENAAHLSVDDSRPTHEEPGEAHRIMAGLLAGSDDLVGIYVAGGGISGVLEALREAPEARRRAVRVVCRDMGPATHRGLAEGLITATLCHPLERTSEQLVQTMLDAIGQPKGSPILQRTIPFEIVTPANV
ncbi:LacI family DNA-binding transcriptional regulator [Rubellimicrobium aerolatum]|uniref:LacI family DNA-binding transcriptional regulator n=1 Tax=Rubellimicrobium aerolatum TaxID=490979 RepID=A0ABW0SHE8_9RHOB|nr:LacI family DNA-binding transcriptional regulator [Rubellimicrobium aerolatum]MBP1807730.1 LacI family transcriptional regulator [Rubellimicrobium aerolatum]